MSLYHEAGYTIDALRPIGDEAPPAISVAEQGAEAQIEAAHDEYQATVAGPLTLDIDDAGAMTLSASVGGTDDAQTAMLGWGDGYGVDLKGEGVDPALVEHTYAVEGNKNIAVQATIDGAQYALAKDHWLLAP